jgi:hypothetical protein
VIWMTTVWLEVSLNPDPSKLPFSGTLSDLVNGLAAVALILALGAVVLSAGRWGMGVATSNLSWAEQGKMGVIVSALAALLIGGAAILINFFFGIGTNLH